MCILTVSQQHLGPNKSVKMKIVFVTGVPCLQHGCVRRGAKQETLYRRKFLDHQPEENELGPPLESKTDDHGWFQFPTSHPPMQPATV